MGVPSVVVVVVVVFDDDAEPESEQLLLMPFTSLRCRRLDSNQHVRGS